MAVSAGVFETSVAATTGCAVGRAPRIGGGGTLARANSASSTRGGRASAAISDIIAPLLKTSRERFAPVRGPDWTASCNWVSAALVAAASAAASVAVDAGEIAALRALMFRA